MRVTAKLADTLAKRITPTGATWDELRDHQFDTKQLDMITDMVQNRLKRKEKRL